MLGRLRRRLGAAFTGDEAGERGQTGQVAEPGPTDDADENERGSSVWDLIPAWQYDGRHVESGGLARDEQERALVDVRREADRVERDARK